MNDQHPPPYGQPFGASRPSTPEEFEAERQRILARHRSCRRAAIGGGVAAGLIVTGVGV
ncbi:hypothetical protein [Nocardioides marmotae]|uniref:hypothetical protein n=1 Tax=Nocardioides marmotae TaxID=2663857 RepID=UPI0012B65250|nr:hypothetical protein [Nocardioides marmotae]MBC9731586.1 hypothetical protein [Nocardioides marmotae]MTB82708.1 hypothetical protein [Nocardioides marmotae]